MRLAIENFASMKAEYKYLFLGGMMELGEYSIHEHAEIINLVTSLNLKNAILVGGDFEKINQPYPFFKNSNEAATWLNENMPTNALVLIKGSRGIKMEKLMDCF